MTQAAAQAYFAFDVNANSATVRLSGATVNIAFMTYAKYE
jgi:hypothetical protein